MYSCSPIVIHNKLANIITIDVHEYLAIIGAVISVFFIVLLKYKVLNNNPRPAVQNVIEVM